MSSSAGSASRVRATQAAWAASATGERANTARVASGAWGGRAGARGRTLRREGVGAEAVTVGGAAVAVEVEQRTERRACPRVPAPGAPEVPTRRASLRVRHARAFVRRGRSCRVERRAGGAAQSRARVRLRRARGGRAAAGRHCAGPAAPPAAAARRARTATWPRWSPSPAPSGGAATTRREGARAKLCAGAGRGRARAREGARTRRELARVCARRATGTRLARRVQGDGRAGALERSETVRGGQSPRRAGWVLCTPDTGFSDADAAMRASQSSGRGRVVPRLRARMERSTADTACPRALSPSLVTQAQGLALSSGTADLCATPFLPLSLPSRFRARPSHLVPQRRKHRCHFNAAPCCCCDADTDAVPPEISYTSPDSSSADLRTSTSDQNLWFQRGV